MPRFVIPPEPHACEMPSTAGFQYFRSLWSCMECGLVERIRVGKQLVRIFRP